MDPDPALRPYGCQRAPNLVGLIVGGLVPSVWLWLVIFIAAYESVLLASIIFTVGLAGGGIGWWLRAVVATEYARNECSPAPEVLVSDDMIDWHYALYMTMAETRLKTMKLDPPRPAGQIDGGAKW